jgi:hypothetical protein
LIVLFSVSPPLGTTLHAASRPEIGRGFDLFPKLLADDLCTVDRSMQLQPGDHSERIDDVDVRGHVSVLLPMAGAMIACPAFRVHTAAPIRR